MYGQWHRVLFSYDHLHYLLWSNEMSSLNFCGPSLQFQVTIILLLLDDIFFDPSLASLSCYHIILLLDDMSMQNLTSNLNKSSTKTAYDVSTHFYTKDVPKCIGCSHAFHRFLCTSSTGNKSFKGWQFVESST